MTLKPLSLALALTISGAFAAAPAFAQTTDAPKAETPAAAAPAPDAVVATVGDVAITNAKLDQAVAEMGQQFQNVPAEQRRARALDALIDIEVFAALARKDGLDKNAEVQRQTELLVNRALHNNYFRRTIQPAITDEMLKARYDAELAKVEPEQEVKARHILVKTKDEAKAIIKQLEEGGDFVAIAKEKSTGPSGPQGGDLGWFGKGRMVPEFETAAFALEKGAFTREPVKSQFGYHVIRKDDVRDRPLPNFEQAKGQLRQLLMTEAYAKAVEEGRAALGVALKDESLKLPEAPKQP